MEHQKETIDCFVTNALPKPNLEETVEVTKEYPKEKQPEKKESLLDSVFSLLKTMLVSLIVVNVIAHFIWMPVIVSGNSMYPTLEDKAIGFSNLIGYRLSSLKRFDIVVVSMEDSDRLLVKRIIGLPGETISYKDEQLYINGEKIEEDFLDEAYKASYDVFTRDIEEITLKEGEYYCLGDNRPVSQDSRYYGPFNKDHIVSKGILILYPLNQFGFKSW